MEQDWDIPTLVTTADGCVRDGQIERMRAMYAAWVAGHADHALLYLVYYNLGVTLSGVGDPVGAQQAYEESLRRNPDFCPSYINLGNVLEQRISPEAAADCWRQLTERLAHLNPETLGFKNSALQQIGRVGDAPSVEWALRMSLEINPHQHNAMEHWISSRQQQCKWPVIEPFAQCAKEHLLTGFAPLSLAAYTDDPLMQLANAGLYNNKDIGHAPEHFLAEHAALRASPAPRPRVGYLSSDLRLHAIGFLMVELFERHDPARVDLYFYYTGQPTEDPLQRRIRAAAPHWRELTGLDDATAARRILADRIEILVDINGYTLSARLKMLSMRPAPVIVNWLGYPGTMGSAYHHYIIADPFIIPPGYEIFYTEQVKRLPCYQPNDSRRLVAAERPTRQEVGLPEEGVVFCCFNGVRKITAFTLDLWCQILHRVPGSVLWLLHESDAARDRLRELAAQRGVDPERLLFAPLLPNEHHLARYPLVDLVVDCFPYGAHTTASDALWMGIPILTMAGLSFPSRVCGSLVSAAGLGELVCATPEAYVEQAVALGLNPSRLRELRDRLEGQRAHCVLFDMTALARHLEDLFVEMRADFLADRLPRPDLANLEIYQRIAIGLDSAGGGWRGTLEELHILYANRLAEEDRLCHLGEDSRCWNGTVRRHRQQPPGESLLARIVAADEAKNLAGVIACANVAAGDLSEALRALSALLDGMRLQAAYILAMVLANQGHRHPWIALGLWLGGVLWNNPGEESRGLAIWRDPLVGLSPWLEQRVREQARVLIGVVGGRVAGERLGAFLNIYWWGSRGIIPLVGSRGEALGGVQGR
ncbi:MAG: hypothetical protein HQL95_15685, partial [Magnetococcales bacterium]|nr:hypothetical protein [Magnetococcales bacterium]